MEGFQDLEPGDPERVGPYRIVARLGGGGMGQVYLGQSLGGRAFAVKVIRPELAQDGDFRRRFVREVASARRVNGVFTAGVVDADPEGSPAWLATAYVPGVPLDQAVIRHGPWAEQPATALAAALAEALEGIHAVGVVHRDLKPSNVLLAADGPRVIDFGISLPQGSAVTSITGAGQVAGTPGFMSPEQLKALPVGPASDVFSLGALLALVTTGSGPFGHGSLHELMFRIAYEEPRLDGVPPGLRAVIARCLAKDPQARPTVRALLHELAESVNHRQDAAFTTAGWLPEAVARDVHTRSTAPLLAGPPGAALPPVRTEAGDVPSASVAAPAVTGLGAVTGLSEGGTAASAEPMAPLTDPAAPAGAHPPAAPAAHPPTALTGQGTPAGGYQSTGTFGPGRGAGATGPGTAGPATPTTGPGSAADSPPPPRTSHPYGAGAPRAASVPGAAAFADPAPAGPAAPVPPSDPLVHRRQPQPGGTPSGPVPAGAAPSRRSARRRQPKRGLWVAAAVCAVLGVGVTTWLVTPFSQGGAHAGTGTHNSDGSAAEDVVASAAPGASVPAGIAARKPTASPSAGASATSSPTATGPDRPKPSASPGHTTAHPPVTSPPQAAPPPSAKPTSTSTPKPPASGNSYFVSYQSQDYTARGTITWGTRSVTISGSITQPADVPVCAEVHFFASYYGGSLPGLERDHSTCDSENYSFTINLPDRPEDVRVYLISNSESQSIDDEEYCTPTLGCS